MKYLMKIPKFLKKFQPQPKPQQSPGLREDIAPREVLWQKITEQEHTIQGLNSEVTALRYNEEYRLSSRMSDIEWVASQGQEIERLRSDLETAHLRIAELENSTS